MDWLNALSTAVTAIATVAICIFAGVQIFQAVRERNDRRRAALASLRTEYIRISHVAERWAEFDLLGFAIADTLESDELDPPDWGLVTTLLGQAGDTAGVIAGVSYPGFATLTTRSSSWSLQLGTRSGRMLQRSEVLRNGSEERW